MNHMNMLDIGERQITPLEFISNSTNNFTDETIRQKFRNGYCWHFAHMLKSTFDTGRVCLAYPFGHFVYEYGGSYFDIEGYYSGESETFIPEEYLGEHLENFIHRGVSVETTLDDIKKYTNNTKGHNDLIRLRQRFTKRIPGYCWT